MKRITAWLMLACLIFIQAHSFVHHHHVALDAAAKNPFAIVDIHHDSCEQQGEGLNSVRPEFGPHTEGFLAKFNRTSALRLDLDAAFSLPSAEVVIPELRSIANSPITLTGDFPLILGPPLETAPRAPPVSAIA